jgi:hypothetical protein
MKTNGFDASFGGGSVGSSLSRKVFAALLIIALLFASVPAISAFAAPAAQGQTPGSGLEQDWGNKISQLRAAGAWFDNFQTRPGLNRSCGNMGQYLDRFRVALASAQALIVSGNGFNSSGQVTNDNQARRSVQQLGTYLGTMRGLRQNITEGNNNASANCGSAANNNQSATQGNSGPGIPVTGGAGTTNNTNNQNNNQGNNQNNNQGNNQNNNQSNNQNNNQSNNQNSPAQIWGGQYRELRVAQSWFNNFRSQPGLARNNDRMSQYLDRYAFALRQANALIVNGSNSNGQTVTRNWGTPQQQLAMYLHMMRGLREKILQGGE